MSKSLIVAADTISVLISHFKYQSYLEIGCDLNNTFSTVECPIKVGVDPIKGGTVRMTSNDFFEKNTEKFDLIFIDGSHHHAQVYQDVENALAALNDNGTIVMHDCNPCDEAHESQHACGTAWRAMAMYRGREDLTSVVFDFNHGVGMLRRGENLCPVHVDKTMDELTYDDLQRNRSTLLNLQPPQAIYQMIAAV